MRLFQNANVYSAYLPRLDGLANSNLGFSGRVGAFLDDRYAAAHILMPISDNHPEAFFTVGNDATLQKAWAREHGLPSRTSLKEIMLAQMEEHRTEVFYNLDPIRFGNDFVSKLPSSVKRHIAWRAAPSPHTNFDRYHWVVSNFPSILKSYAELGFRTAFFFPAHDPIMNHYAMCKKRPIDILFVGGFSRHHKRRAAILESVASLGNRWNVRFHLDQSRLTRLAESPLGIVPPLRKYRLPHAIRHIARGGVFGRALYDVLAASKIVINAAVDMAGEDRGNMRCFEAMGCGALLLSDEGRYPDGMISGETHLTYRDNTNAAAIADRLLALGPEHLSALAKCGHEMISTRYTRERQWRAFIKLCE